MADYSLNTGLPEPSRSLDDKGYNGIFTTTSPPTARRYNDSTSAPLEKSHPLVNEVDGSANTTTLAWPEAAGDINKRTRNG